MHAAAGAGLHGVRPGTAPGQGPVQAPANFWRAKENAEIERAARESGEAAARARVEQKMGYLSRGMGLPATSDPTQDAYWARADMAAWANANKELAQKQGWDPNRNYSAAMNTSSVQGIGPVADGDQYARNLAAVQGTSGIGPVADGDTYGQMIAPAPAAPGPVLLAGERGDFEPPNPALSFDTGSANTSPPVAATAFTPSAATPQEQAGQVLDQYTAQIKATKGINPEVNFDGVGGSYFDEDEIARNAYGLNYNTRQFF
jgi:hypothetical protein